MNQQATPSPTQISNRTFIEKMRLWGWTEARTRGDYTRMEGPAGKIDVSSTGSHRGNSPFVVKEILAALEKHLGRHVTWSEFVSRDEPLIVPQPEVKIASMPLTGSVQPQPTQPRPTPSIPVPSPTLFTKHEPEPEPVVAAPTTEGEPAVAAVESTPQVEDDEQESSAEARNRNEGITQAVREVMADGEQRTLQEISDLTGYTTIELGPTCARLVEQQEFFRVALATYKARPKGIAKADAKPRPRSVGVKAAVLEALARDGRVRSIGSLTEEIGFTRNSVGGALRALLAEGAATRTSGGTYQVSASYLRKMPEQHSSVSTVTPLIPVEPVRPPLVLHTTTPGVVVQATVASEDIEDTLNEVLDLLFPNGFKAKHLPKIDVWKQTTRDLITEIGAI